MDLRHMRYFVTVAEALSFTRGAEKLHLAQPSLTRQIKNLEEETGVRLLDRTKARLSWTPEGQSFLVDAKRVLELSEQIVESVRHFSRHELAPLNIGYVANLFYDLLLFFFSSRRRHTRLQGDWSSDVCSSDLCPCPGFGLGCVVGPRV